MNDCLAERAIFKEIDQKVRQPSIYSYVCECGFSTVKIRVYTSIDIKKENIENCVCVCVCVYMSENHIRVCLCMLCLRVAGYLYDNYIV